MNPYNISQNNPYNIGGGVASPPTAAFDSKISQGKPKSFLDKIIQPVKNFFTNLPEREQAQAYNDAITHEPQEPGVTSIKVPFINAQVSQQRNFLTESVKYLVETPERFAQTIKDNQNLITKGFVPPPEKGKVSVDSYIDAYNDFYNNAKANGLDEAGARIASSLFVMGQGILDATLVGSLLEKSALGLLDETASSVAKKQAWEVLKMPKTAEEAQQNFVKLAHKFHPDKGGDEAIFKIINNANTVIKEQGIPSLVEQKVIPNVRQWAKTLLSEPGANVASEAMTTPGISGLLPGTAPIGGKTRPAFGLSIQPVEDVGRAKNVLSKAKESFVNYILQEKNPAVLFKDLKSLGLTDAKATALSEHLVQMETAEQVGNALYQYNINANRAMTSGSISGGATKPLQPALQKPALLDSEIPDQIKSNQLSKLEETTYGDTVTRPEDISNDEAGFRAEVIKEMGTGKQFNDQANKQLASDIVAAGGLKVDPNNPGEYQNIPLHLLRNDGLTADGMLEALNQGGKYNFESEYDVLEQASYIKGAANNLKPLAVGHEAAIAKFKGSFEAPVNNPEGARTAFDYADGEVQTLKSKDREDIVALAFAADLKKDISGFTGQAKDVYRIFEQVFGKNSKAKEVILDKFDEAKRGFVVMQEKLISELKAGVTDKFGFKIRSKESAAIMDYGEGFTDKAKLINKFGEEKSLQIIEADKFFRNQYDELIEKVNRSRKEIYGDMWQKKANMDKEIKILKEQLHKKEDIIRTKKRTDTLTFEKLKRTKYRLTDAIEKRIALVNSEDWWRGKIIPKRKDYYRHFEEMGAGIEGLKNAFETASGISPKLSGVSEFTKPKSKFLSFAQKRIGVVSERDAIGGFLNYTQAASYAIHIDPQVARFRELANQLALATEQSKNLNNFIEFLQDYANDLAGKTNAADRYIQKIIPGGRTTMRVIDWANKRIKANVILGNLSSSIAQIFNVPQGLASAKQYSVRGATKTLASIFTENTAMKESGFIKERYARSMYGDFDTGLIENTKKFAVWMTGVLDEVGTKFIWNSHFEKALVQKITDPVRYADGMTRKLVAGRGVGEVPLIQKSKLVQVFAPFQLEVGNAWWAMKDMVSEKDFTGIAVFLVASYLMNQVAKKIRGSDVVFDPINATYDGIKAFIEEDNKALGLLKLGGREAGEVLSNLPLGQTLAALYPEYGIGGVTRKELFGEGDPTRFGGGILLSKGLQDPLFKLVLPFGGAQIEKSIEGFKTYAEGKDTTPTGKTRFKVEHNPVNFFQSLMFGKGSLQAAQEYYDRIGGGASVKTAAPKINPYNQ